MPNVSSPAALPQYIEELLAQHKHHSAALATIESTLARVTAALGGTSLAGAPSPAKKKPGRPPLMKAPVVSKPVLAPKAVVVKPVAKASPATPAKVAPAKALPAKTAPKKFAMTANEFVLSFVQSKKNPTSQEVNKAWKDAGRLGLADNNLSLLTKAKKLKRTPLGAGLRGSRYTIA